MPRAAGAMMSLQRRHPNVESHWIRRHPRTLPPVLPDVVAARPRPLGPRPFEGEEPADTDLGELVARLARLLVPAHDPCLRASRAGAGLEGRRVLYRCGRNYRCLRY